MIDVNLTGSFLCSKEAIIIMKKQKYGHILFLNSLSGKRVLPWGSGYSASKYGLKGFADTIRLELRKFNIKGTVKLCLLNKLHYAFFFVVFSRTRMNRYSCTIYSFF